jgi:hypothetical protein
MKKDMINQHNKYGIRHGMWKYYYGEKPNQLMYIGIYNNGLLHGLWEWYFYSGLTEFKGELKKNKHIGLWYHSKYEY